MDKELRPAKYNSKIGAWNRKRFLATPNSIKKKIDNISSMYQNNPGQLSKGLDHMYTFL